MTNTNYTDPFDEEDWDENPSSIFSLGIILDELQSGKISDEEIKRYVEVKSEVSSKNDPVKELLFLRDHISLLSSKVNSFVYKRLIELKKENLSQEEKNKIIKIDKDLLSVIEVSKIIGVSRQQVYNLMDDRKLPYIQVGEKGRKVLKSELEKYISSRKKG
jgi:excisionase family DNA binding protein